MNIIYSIILIVFFKNAVASECRDLFSNVEAERQTPLIEPIPMPWRRNFSFKNLVTTFSGTAINDSDRHEPTFLPNGKITIMSSRPTKIWLGNPLPLQESNKAIFNRAIGGSLARSANPLENILKRIISYFPKSQDYYDSVRGGLVHLIDENTFAVNQRHSGFVLFGRSNLLGQSYTHYFQGRFLTPTGSRKNFFSLDTNNNLIMHNPTGNSLTSTARVVAKLPHTVSTGLVLKSSDVLLYDEKTFNFFGKTSILKYSTQTGRLEPAEIQRPNEKIVSIRETEDQKIIVVSFGSGDVTKISVYDSNYKLLSEISGKYLFAVPVGNQFYACLNGEKLTVDVVRISDGKIVSQSDELTKIKYNSNDPHGVTQKRIVERARASVSNFFASLAENSSRTTSVDNHTSPEIDILNHYSKNVFYNPETQILSFTADWWGDWVNTVYNYKINWN